MSFGRRPILICTIAMGLIAAGVTILSLRERGPRAPDLSTMELGQAMAYEASDEYLLLAERERRRFSEGVLQRLRELPFEQLLAITLNPENLPMQRKRLANLRKLPNYDELHSQMAADFLRKFYGLPPFKRSVYLTAFALLQELDARTDPDRYKVPDGASFHREAVKVFSGQSPAMKAYGMQFMLDLRERRRKLGLPERMLPMH